MANENRLIDANAFFSKLQKLSDLMRQGKIGEIDLNLLVASMPTVDAVEVVRCKDCKHYDKHELVCELIFNPCATNVAWYPEDFCSYGERKDGE